MEGHFFGGIREFWLFAGIGLLSRGWQVRVLPGVVVATGVKKNLLAAAQLLTALDSAPDAWQYCVP
jgi:hypothetical protein